MVTYRRRHRDRTTPCSRPSPIPGAGACSMRCGTATAGRLGELCAVLPTMTRFGVMKHLGRARAGRARRHPARRAHEAALPQPGPDPPDPRPLDHQVRRAGRRRRWSGCGGTSKHLPPRSAHGGDRDDRADATSSRPTSGPRPRRSGRRSPIPAFTRAVLPSHGDREHVRAGRRRGAMTLPDGSEAVCGEIEEVDPPRRLVMTWRVLYDAAMAEEPPSRVEWLLTRDGDGVTRVTTIHRDLGRSPLTSASVGDGWPWVLDSLKSLLETGAPLDGAGRRRHRRRRRRRRRPSPLLAVDANNSTWELLGRDDLHGRRGRRPARPGLRRGVPLAPGRRAATRERRPGGVARCSRVHAVLGQGELALHHADRCWRDRRPRGLADFDLAYAHEARARALACLGRLDEAAAELAAARAVADRRRRGPRDLRGRPRRRAVVRTGCGGYAVAGCATRWRRGGPDHHPGSSR